MPRGYATPTDQSGTANSPGLPHSDSMPAAPATGSHANVSITVTYSLESTDGSAGLFYNVGAGDVTLDNDIDEGVFGPATVTFSLGTIDLTSFVLKVKATGISTPTVATVTSWSISYDGFAGLIADTGAAV